MTRTTRIPIARRWRRRATVSVVTALMLTVPAAVASANEDGAGESQANEAASCLGHEASAVSPPGISDEFPGGMPGLMRFLREEFPDVPAGQIIQAFAHLHSGSHLACDEAFGG